MYITPFYINCKQKRLTMLPHHPVIHTITLFAEVAMQGVKTLTNSNIIIEVIRDSLSCSKIPCRSRIELVRLQVGHFISRAMPTQIESKSNIFTISEGKRVNCRVNQLFLRVDRSWWRTNAENVLWKSTCNGKVRRIHVFFCTILFYICVFTLRHCQLNDKCTLFLLSFLSFLPRPPAANRRSRRSWLKRRQHGEWRSWWPSG